LSQLCILSYTKGLPWFNFMIHDSKNASKCIFDIILMGHPIKMQLYISSFGSYHNNTRPVGPYIGNTHTHTHTHTYTHTHTHTYTHTHTNFITDNIVWRQSSYFLLHTSQQCNVRCANIESSPVWDTSRVRTAWPMRS